MPPRRDDRHEIAYLREQVAALIAGLTEMRVSQDTLFARFAHLLPPETGASPPDRTAHPADVASDHPPSSDDEETLTMDNPFARHGRREQPPLGTDSRWESSFRLDIPEFRGDSNADDYLDWIHTVEDLLDFKSVSANRCVALVATRFRDRASSW